jgi:hypothetical protein
MRTDLPLDALEMALWQRDVRRGQLVHHSDKGCQCEGPRRPRIGPAPNSTQTQRPCLPISPTVTLHCSHQQLVAKYGDLYVFGVRRRAQADRIENSSDEHEHHGARHHGLILPGWHRACSQLER